MKATEKFKETIKALLVGMADKLDCECEHSSDMHLALDILVKKYLEILKV